MPHTRILTRATLLTAAALVALAAVLAPLRAAPPAAAFVPPGLGVASKQAPGGGLVVRSQGRFELHLDEAGIVAWYDLARDPARATNLVTPGERLLRHVGPDGVPLRAVPRVELVNPVLVRVAWRGPGFSREYEIWAAGQVTVRTSGEGGPPALARARAAITGAALQEDGDDAATLFLGVWTGEERGQAADLRTAGPSGLRLEPQGGAIVAAAGDGPLDLVVPAAVGLRAPRFIVEGWPGPEFALRRSDTLLVAGQDYLAHWDAATARLYVQLFIDLPAGGDAARRSFSFLPQTESGLSLGIAGRTLDPSGLLQIDGNLPDPEGQRSTTDIFLIPYIQDSPLLQPTAVYQGQGAGVEFVLSGGGLAAPLTARVFGPAATPLAAAFRLPARGEYRLDGYLIDSAGTRVPGMTDAIAQLAYGRIVLTIGDSITAGFGSDAVPFGAPAYPVNTPERSPAASADRRTYYQFDNSNYTDRVAGVTAPFFRGYQTSLAGGLVACSAAPAFILNSGIQGLRTRLQPKRNERPINRYAYTKLSAYIDQIERLGARFIFLSLGTNDVSDALDPTAWAQDGLGGIIAAIQGRVSGTTIWIPRIPYRKDSSALRNLTVDFNRAIDTVVAARDGQGGAVRVGPDLYTYFQQNQGQFIDDVHPNGAGYEAMAAAWGEPAVAGLPCAAMQADPPPDPGPDPSPSPSPSPSSERIYLPLLRATGR